MLLQQLQWKPGVHSFGQLARWQEHKVVALRLLSDLKAEGCVWPSMKCAIKTPAGLSVFIVLVLGSGLPHARWLP